ncbi:type IV secretion system lytic transglycosylase VirB1 [Methylophilaceae bacterium]
MILDNVTIQQCAPMVDQQLMMRVISVESSHNPYAIGVVNAHLQRQPQTLTEAKATAHFLENAGYNYSVGLAQINRSNFRRFNLNFDNVFEVCTNLNAGGQMLSECLNRASARGYQADATHKALSCYYSGQLNSAVGTQYANKVLVKLSVNTRPANNKAIQISAISTDKPENAVVF